VPRSGDSTARIWDLSRGRGSPLSTALPHKTDKNQQSKDVTTLDWNGDGSLLATGSYDGIARIWSRSGEAAIVSHPPCCRSLLRCSAVLCCFNKQHTQLHHACMVSATRMRCEPSVLQP